jgi:DNA-binding MarR family transcriptional regulator
MPPPSRAAEPSPSSADSELDALARYLGANSSRTPSNVLRAVVCVARILRIAEKISADQERAAQAFSLSAGDVYTLYLLQRVPGEAARPGDLAKALNVSTGGMTKRLDRLEGAGCIVRERDPNDRRGIVIRLTPEGARTANAAREHYRALQPHELNQEIAEADWAQLDELLLRVEAVLADNRAKKLQIAS